ncbi:MAG: DUF5018 domain-containing protein, partial [bacterium]
MLKKIFNSLILLVMFLSLASCFGLSSSISVSNSNKYNGNHEQNTLSSEKDIISFSIAGVSGVISGTDISVVLPFGTSLSGLVPSITVSLLASIGASSQAVPDFSEPVSYTVKAEDGSTKVYTVTVTLAGPLSSNKNIEGFFILDFYSMIAGTEIFITAPYGTDITSLAPTIFVSEGASVSPGSGVINDFTEPAIYTVTAEDGSTKEYTVLITVDNKVTFIADGIGFRMASVPGGLTFPTGLDDIDTATVANSFWIGETEVTYELWTKVREWAVLHGYTFANDGFNGTCGLSCYQTHPVTMINWRDSMVFCNAITEWYNAKNETNYTFVYKSSGLPIRDSRDSNAEQCDSVTPDETATGFRLPSRNEWELAARYIGKTEPAYGMLSTERKTTVVNGVTYYWTPGNYASGADSDVSYPDATGAVAWFADNSSYSTHDVGLKFYNQLGLNDISGNIVEWNFDRSFNSYHVVSG